MVGDKTRSPRPSARLIGHDVRVRLKLVSPGVAEVVATVECERRQCTLDVERCAYCERFARIEVHEAGYTLLCRSEDQQDQEDQEDLTGMLPGCDEHSDFAQAEPVSQLG